jgi:hypothetical protein
MDETVAAWFDQTKNPMVDVMKAVRAIIMEDPDISETVKYRAPAFEYDGLMCYFNWSAKKAASLIFPAGRSIPGDHEDLVDGSNVQRIMYFDSINEVEAKADGLRVVIDAYIASR